MDRVELEHYTTKDCPRMTPVRILSGGAQRRLVLELPEKYSIGTYTLLAIHFMLFYLFILSLEMLNCVVIK